ncbi:MAG TPA: CHASE3 domain-containing protein [Chthoniobacterales bacterium]
MPADERTNRLKRPVLPRDVGRGASIGFSLAILALLVSGWLSFHNIRRIARNEGLVVHTHEVLDELRDSLKLLAQAESAQRSYLITGDTTYLDPHRAIVADIQRHLDRLKSLTSDNPIQQIRLAKLESLINDRIDSLQTGITTRQTQGAEGAQRYVQAGKGRQEMTSIRDLVDGMVQTELRLLAVRETESSISYHTSVATQWTTTFLGLGLVVAAYLLAARESATRQQGIEALARANDELEMRVETRTADLAAANESLQRSNRELEQFASVASHDLQEPLRKIQAFGDRLQTRCAETLGEHGRDYLKRMLASATRMRSLIDALLTFSRVTTKAQPFVTVDLATTAEEVVSDLEDRVHRMGGRVEVGALPSLEADPLQMRQLLQNLIGNGLKFARPNEQPVVRVEGRVLTPKEGNGTVPRCEISVSDNGIGFEEVYLDRIFELFQRLHGRQEYEGTGMGLAICRKIVERHGGTITARSAPGRGATFLVNLPLRQI